MYIVNPDSVFQQISTNLSNEKSMLSEIDCWTCYRMQAATLLAKFMGPIWGPIWGRQDPGGPHVDPMNLVFWVCFMIKHLLK